MAASSGSEQLRALALRLRAAEQGAWLLQMMGEMRAIARDDLVPAVQESAQKRLPRGGGLNERVASAPVTVSVRAGARTAGVRMFTRDHDTKTTNAGYVRHPVFGTWRAGVESQSIPEAAGWWDDPLREQSPAVTPVLMHVMERVASEIQGRGI